MVENIEKGKGNNGFLLTPLFTKTKEPNIIFGVKASSNLKFIFYELKQSGRDPDDDDIYGNGQW